MEQKLRLLKGMVKHRKALQSHVVSFLLCVDNQEQSIWGSITAEDERGIRFAVELARSHPGPIVEIGALFGHTTNLIASLKARERTLIAVENFSWNPFFLPPAAHRLFTNRTLRYVMLHCAVQLHDGSAEEFYKQNSDILPSMIFIDAGHDYNSVRRDIAWALASGCPVISGHDYSPNHPGVIQAVDEAFEGQISRHGSVWVHSR
jgi:predicted O-methyltransferase YrrM